MVILEPQVTTESINVEAKGWPSTPLRALLRRPSPARAVPRRSLKDETDVRMVAFSGAERVL